MWRRFSGASIEPTIFSIERDGCMFDVCVSLHCDLKRCFKPRTAHIRGALHAYTMAIFDVKPRSHTQLHTQQTKTKPKNKHSQLQPSIYRQTVWIYTWQPNTQFNVCSIDIPDLASAHFLFTLSRVCYVFSFRLAVISSAKQTASANLRQPKVKASDFTALKFVCRFCSSCICYWSRCKWMWYLLFVFGCVISHTQCDDEYGSWSTFDQVNITKENMRGNVYE